MIFRELWSYTAGSSRWTEVWYSNHAGIDTASTFTPGFKAARMALASAQCTWQTVDITAVTDPTLHAEVRIAERGLVPAALDEHANPGEAMVCKLRSEAVPAHRFWWCRGIPDSWVRFGALSPRGLLDAAVPPLLNAWFGALQVSGYVILKRRARTVVGFRPVYIQSADGTAANLSSVITFKTAHGFVVDDLITFHRINRKILPGLSGTFKVLAVAGLTITIGYSTPEDRIITTIQGYARKLEYHSDATIRATACRFSHMGTRDTKNDITGSRGAQRAVRLRG